MSGEARCDCCDLPAYSCGRAVQQAREREERAERARLLALPGVVAATFGGVCSRCGDGFEVGDPIRYDRAAAAGDGSGGNWQAVLCCGPADV